MKKEQTCPSALTLSALAVTIFAIFTATASATSPAKLVHSFNSNDGANPTASVIFDTAGNLYGTTSAGGTHGYGTVFKLTLGSNGKWTETVLHNFNNIDGANPEGALIFDSAGNLYGTTSQGGAHANGAVFQLSPGANGTWTETVLYSFQGFDGSHPYGSLVFDALGNLYGTTYQGGNFAGNCIYGGCGTVFKVSPNGNGTWSGTAIHAFIGQDGAAPFCNLIFDASGNLYGTTTGYNYNGTVFKLTPGANGQWTATVLHTFQNSQLYSGLVFDQAGNLYGTTWDGGARSAGTVFELSPGANGIWTLTTLHSFNTKDGSFVYAGVVFDAAGNLWGTTAGYGSDLGSVYELIPNGGSWTINVLHTFKDIEVNGGITFDAAGNVYTTTGLGGNAACSEGCGTVLEIAP